MVFRARTATTNAVDADRPTFVTATEFFAAG
jgi:hypothetical protein